MELVNETKQISSSTILLKLSCKFRVALRHVSSCLTHLHSFVTSHVSWSQQEFHWSDTNFLLWITKHLTSWYRVCPNFQAFYQLTFFYILCVVTLSVCGLLIYLQVHCLHFWTIKHLIGRHVARIKSQGFSVTRNIKLQLSTDLVNTVKHIFYTYIYTHNRQTHTHIHTYIHTHTHIYIHINIHIHVHTYTARQWKYNTKKEWFERDESWGKNRDGTEE